MIKRSITIHGHRTSISLEQPFWQEISHIAEQRQCSISQLVTEIDSNRSEMLKKGEKTHGLSSMVRIFILENALAQTRSRK